MIDFKLDDAQENILLWKLSSDWELSEFHEALKASSEMLEALDLVGKVDVVVVMPNTMRMPKGSWTSAIGRGIRTIGETGDGIVVVVAANQLHITILNVLHRGLALFGSRLRTARSLDEAREIVRQHRLQIA